MSKLTDRFGKSKWLTFTLPHRRVSTAPCMYLRRPEELLALRNTADMVSVCCYGHMAHDVDENEVGMFDGHRVFLLPNME